MRIGHGGDGLIQQESMQRTGSAEGGRDVGLLGQGRGCGAYRIDHVGGRTGRLRRGNAEQLVRGDAEQRGDIRQQLDIRAALCRFPLGNGLVGDVQPEGELLLCPAVLTAQA